jgi:glycosyltransferase involved in cell wall biosynthesis
MAEPGTISVVVPTHQRRERVLALLTAVGRQTFPAARFEVVVSIDGSTDGTREALERVTAGHGLRALWHARRGRAAALNAGIQASSGSLVVLLDDDMEPAPEWLAAHWRAHEDRRPLGVMGAVPIAVAAGAPPAVRYVAAKFNGHLANLARPDRPLQLTDFYSGNFSVRHDVLAAVGGFDEDFQLYGNEDLELSFRLSRAGVALRFDATARAVQHNDKGFVALAEDSLAEGRTAVLFALKHPDAFAHLKLGTFARGPRGLRLVRDRLLRLGGRGARLPGWLIRCEAGLARLDPPGMPTFYRLALGYLYWLGARQAIDEERSAGRSIGPLGQLAKDLRL